MGLREVMYISRKNSKNSDRVLNHPNGVDYDEEEDDGCGVHSKGD